ncbi:Protein kish [Mucor velutinosus]|uniref:Exosome complex protein n=1 Tax=Mucor velutinosus TaxID=708070 RepID=A0AAN7DBS3_9FUNG|nr:Protein kish [Mucor velutinosus]
MDPETPSIDIPKKAVRALKVRLQVVKKHLEPLLSKPINDVFSKLSVNQRYELEVLLSYSLNSLYYIYLRTQGSDPQKHEVVNELLRVQQYIQKLKKAQGKEAKPTMRVDKDAAARFIKNAINEGASENEKATADKKRKLEETVFISSDEEDEHSAKKDAFSNHSKSSEPSKKKKKNKNRKA